jgi:DUF4097 and DUF4098 domain-containing protein YvlB
MENNVKKDDFLKCLELALIDANIGNYEEIIEKYKKHFETANAAGMTEEEAIKMMGPINSIVNKYIVDEEDAKEIYTLKIDDALADKIVIAKSDKPGISITIDDVLLDKLNISRKDKKINISDKFGKSFFRKCRGTILLEIGSEITFDSFEILTVSCDVSIESVVADKCRLYTVSGDFQIEKIITKELVLNSVSGDMEIVRIKTNEIKVSTVSGDVDIDYVEAEVGILDTISGDINLSGKIKLKRGSSITGSINYKVLG